MPEDQQGTPMAKKNEERAKAAERVKFTSGAAQLASLLASQPDLLDGQVVELSLPQCGITGIRFQEITPGNPVVRWWADGSEYVVQLRDLRLLGAFFDALGDQLADMQPTNI
jgi:hypothetical protein